MEIKQGFKVDKLPLDRKLKRNAKGEVTGFVPHSGMKTTIDIIHCVSTTDFEPIVDSTIPVEIEGRGVASYNYVTTANALLDTGSKQANYINREIAEELRSNGAKIDVCSCRNLVCSPIKGSVCVESIDCITIIVKFYNESTQRHNKIEISCTVIDMDEELIIGKQTILKHDLAEKCRSMFRLPDNKPLATVDSAPVVKSGTLDLKGRVSSRVQTLAHLRCVEKLGDVLDQTGSVGDYDPILADVPWQEQSNRIDEISRKHND